MKKIIITLLLLIAMLPLQVAFAHDEPSVTITFDKEHIKVGESIKVEYEIVGPRKYKDIYWSNRIWISKNASQSGGDGWGELENLTGSFSYAPQFGEAISFEIGFTDEVGKHYIYSSDKIEITGYSFIEPKVTIKMDKEVVAIGEPIKVEYEIVGPGKYKDIYWSNRIWISKNASQSGGDGWGELENLTGSFSYASQFGEAISFEIGFTDEAGRHYLYSSDKIEITGYSFIEPKVTIKMDKEVVAIGEPIKVEYEIVGPGKYTDIYWSNRIWISKNASQSGDDGWGELENLTGSFSYTPQFGEAISFQIGFTDEAGRHYIYSSDKAEIKDSPLGHDIYSVFEEQHRQIFTGKNSLIFCSDGDFKKYLGVQVDGKVVPNKYVKSWSGSTHVELSVEYLASLPEGEHKLTIIFNDGVAVTTFATAKTLPQLPQTGDNSHIALWLALLALTGTAILTLKRKTA